MTLALITAAILCASLLAAIVIGSYLHKRHPLTTRLLSESGIANSPLTPQGSVLVNGELWLARSVDGNFIAAKSAVQIVGLDGHLLLVSET